MKNTILYYNPPLVVDMYLYRSLPDNFMGWWVTSIDMDKVLILPTEQLHARDKKLKLGSCLRSYTPHEIPCSQYLAEMLYSGPDAIYLTFWGHCLLKELHINAISHSFEGLPSKGKL